MARNNLIKIPIVNLRNLAKLPCNGDELNVREMAMEFGDALHKFGFAYIVNHGMEQQMIDDAFEVSLQFFKLPQSVKDKYSKVDPLKNFGGYAKPGMEALGDEASFEHRETFDMCQFDRQFPTQELPAFQKYNEDLETACRSLEVKLFKLAAIALQLDDIEFFCKRTKALIDWQVKSKHVYRCLYYPAIPQDTNIVPGLPRCDTHTDWGTITMLFQDDIGGLDVQLPNGEWVAVPPVKGSIVINTGNMMEAWTGAYFRATPHRVLVPEEEVKRRTYRQSIAFFPHPDDDVEVAPICQGVVKDRVNDFQPVNARAYFDKKTMEAYGHY